MVALLQAKGFIPKENKEIRNAQQNRLYHKWLSIIAESSGNTSEALHELMKKKFLSKRKRVTINGKRSYVNIAWSTTKLSVKTFTEYLDNVYTFFSDNGYVLPLMDQLEAESLLASYHQ